MGMLSYALVISTKVWIRRLSRTESLNWMCRQNVDCILLCDRLFYKAELVVPNVHSLNWRFAGLPRLIRLVVKTVGVGVCEPFSYVRQNMMWIVQSTQYTAYRLALIIIVHIFKFFLYIDKNHAMFLYHLNLIGMFPGLKEAPDYILCVAFFIISISTQFNSS